MGNLSVCIIYQTDPLATIPGGIDTFIRGILRWAPDDISMSMVGVTTDRDARPVGRWTECTLGGRKFNFLGMFYEENPGKQRMVPLSVRLLFALMMRSLGRTFDVLEFHRIEPALRFLFDSRPKNIFVHQNMEVLKNENSDIRWKYFPWFFYKLEDLLLTRMQSIFTVRENAAVSYRDRFPGMAERIHFIPTWMDPEIFSPAPDGQRESLKAGWAEKYGFRAEDQLLVSVGRLDHQKNPILMLDAFCEVVKAFPDARLIMVGEGVLKETVEKQIISLGLDQRVILTGLLPQGEIADLLRVADLFVLSSAYEGMPMCVLEAMGCGVPAATTDVGEVRRVVLPGRNGEIAKEQTRESLTGAIRTCLENRERYRGEPNLEVAARYVPQKILAPVYENYRKLAGKHDAGKN